MSNGANLIGCKECGAEVKDYLPDHLTEVHGMSVADYLFKHPGAQTMSARLEGRFAAQKVPRRELPKPPTDLTLNFANVQFQINWDVPEEACLPLPDQYRVPVKGALGEDVQHVSIALKHSRSCYVWGMPGTGKDALFHAWSALTRTPAIIRQVKPGTDIESWFFSRGFDQTGTCWEEGDVLRAIRDGYLTTSGRRIPYLILITDFDRADRDQAEHIRLITDSIEGRVDGPAGKVYKVFPGTRIVATGNTSGGGDERGRMISANPLDASLLDRFERKIQFHYMTWDDEGPVVKSKFPILFQRFPTVETKCREVVKGLRDAVLNGELHGEFSHRGLCNILSHATDLIVENANQANPRKLPSNLMGLAARVWKDGLPDEENRVIASRIIDPHFQSLDEGDTGFIKPAKLPGAK